MKTKSQVQSNVFIYILGFLVLFLIIIFGYKFIANMSDQQKKIESSKFETELKQDVNSLSGNYGSETTEQYELPTAFNEICFVDPDKVDADLLVNYPMIKDSLENGIKKNAFLIGQNIQTIYVEGLTIDYPYFSCFQPKTKEISLKMEGLGNAVLITSSVNQKYCEKAQQDNLCNGLEVIHSGYKSECCTGYKKCC